MRNASLTVGGAVDADAALGIGQLRRGLAQDAGPAQELGGAGGAPGGPLVRLRTDDPIVTLEDLLEVLFVFVLAV
jgi:hypothetical protein